MTNENLDLAGVGVGPFNLSLAALLAPVKRVRARFFERRPGFSWHPGMMLPGSGMQTSFLKDLVTPVDPTSPFGFLSYLVAKGRFYRFLNADFTQVRRVEFADYMRWTAEQLPNLEFGRDINDITFDGHDFVLAAGKGQAPARARNLVIATGLEPHVPSWARRHVGKDCVHSHFFMGSDLALAGKRVAIIGGGQSGAEIFLNVLSGARGVPRHVAWLTRRPNLEPLDETAFTNEWFTPDYVRQFHALPDAPKDAMVRAQKLAGDGVSPVTLRALAQRLYEHDFLDRDQSGYLLAPSREVRLMTREGGGFELHARNGFDDGDELVNADVVILATGYRYVTPPCFASLAPLLARDDDGNLLLTTDYRARWDGPVANRIYMQNAGRHSHGIADAQLSLAAWRSGVIVNSLVGAEIYRTQPKPAPVRWSSGGPTPWMPIAAELRSDEEPQADRVADAE